MRTHRKVQPLRVVGPLGEALTLRTLPPRDAKRWIVRRKAEVVAAVRGGLITSDEACARNRLSDRKSTRLNSSHKCASRMPSSAWKKKFLHLPMREAMNTSS